jgi:hypothetical protein
VVHSQPSMLHTLSVNARNSSTGDGHATEQLAAEDALDGF